MKLLCTLLFLGLAVMPVSASEASDVAKNRAEATGKTYKVFKTRLGWTYRDVTVTKITDAGISIIHADGTARLGYERLTPEQREAFGITEEGAEALLAKEEENKAAYEAHIAAKQQAWQESQAARQLEQQKAYEEWTKAQQALLAKQVAEGSTTEGSVAQAQEAQASKDTTSIVSVLEVPSFPIIRGYDKQVLRPMQGYTRSYRSGHYGSNRTTIYTGGYGGYGRHGGYGGTYGYPVPYSNGCYPSGGYRPSYHRGSWGAINYNGGKWNVGIRW